MSQSIIRFVLKSALMVMTVLNVNGQVIMPDVLNKSTLKEQMNYIEDKTRIYQDYRAIREDMFQKIMGNVSDTLSVANRKIAGLNIITSILNHSIDSLNTTLEETKTSLEEVTRTKNSISVLGIDVNKAAYNTITWTIIAGLIAVLVIGFLIFKRSLLITLNTQKELVEMKSEFEAYRKTTREAREKASMDHFNEIKRLKGG